MRGVLLAWLALACCGAAVCPALAQEGESSAKPAAPSAAMLDIADLWRRAWHRPAPAVRDAASADRKKAFVLAPTFGSKPTTGLSLGVASNIAFFRGDPKTTHISTLNVGIKVTQQRQLLSGFRFSMFTDHDRWFLQGDNRFSLTSQSIYGLGTSTTPADATSVKYDFTKVFESAYRQVSRGLFVGAGIDLETHTVVRAGKKKAVPFDQSALVTYSQSHGLPVDTQTSGGTSLNLLYDTRDGGINPSRGWLASASYRTYVSGFLGGDSTWQELFLDTRTYRNLTSSGRHRLAFWFQGDLVTGGIAPYLDLPALAADGRSGRGYGDGRFRGQQLLYGEMEYRGTLTKNGLIGMVAFLNTTTASDTTPASRQRLGDTFATGEGLGLRVLLNKRSRTNLAADYGWGKEGARGFYLAIQEAF